MGSLAGFEKLRRGELAKTIKCPGRPDLPLPSRFRRFLRYRQVVAVGMRRTGG